MVPIISEKSIRFVRNVAGCMLISTRKKLNDANDAVGNRTDIKRSQRFCYLVPDLQHIFGEPNVTLCTRMVNCISFLGRVHHDYVTFFLSIVQMLLHIKNDLGVNLRGWNEFCDLIGMSHDFEYDSINQDSMIQRTMQNISCVSPSKLEAFLQIVNLNPDTIEADLNTYYNELNATLLLLVIERIEHNKNVSIRLGIGFIVAILCIIAATVVYAKSLIAFKLSVALLSFSYSFFIALVIVCAAIKCCKASQNTESISSNHQESTSPEKTPGKTEPSPEKTPAKPEPSSQTTPDQTFDS